MSRIKKASILLIMLSTLPVLFGYPLVEAARAEEHLDVDQLAEDFFCTCGCNILLSVCETQMICSVASDMKSQIRSMEMQGMNRDEVVDGMVSVYGYAVLAIPPMQGFTLALWWYPVIGGILGVLVIIMVSRRRRNVDWRIDPDEVVALDEEELLKRIDTGETASTATAEKKYDDLLRKKLKEAEK